MAMGMRCCAPCPHVVALATLAQMLRGGIHLVEKRTVHGALLAVATRARGGLDGGLDKDVAGCAG
jgi:hypothetical protein